MTLSNKIQKVAVIGGDERQIHCGKFLAENGFEASVFGFDKLSGDFGLCTKCMTVMDALTNADVLILPTPVTQNQKTVFAPLSDKEILLSDIAKYADKRTIAFGGKTDSVKNMDFKLHDYFKREEYVVANAYLTAESAVSLAMSNCGEAIKDMPVLVMGYGRIGKMLCFLLKRLGANVFASARKKEDFAWIRAFGYSEVDTSRVCDVVSSCKLIFNTIPHIVLGQETLCCIRNDALIIDLASKPGGVDFEAAKKCGLNVLWALALPGKRLPVSAGIAQAKTILEMLEEMGDNE